ncbi:hypothetical protein B0H11DRAFT_1945184 [Mycena galericulata]|nr:hypothetical protein B0H11DRAFT_1945184 [Mycena galericulata]
MTPAFISKRRFRGEAQRVRGRVGRLKVRLGATARGVSEVGRGDASGGKVRFGSGSGAFSPNAEPEPRVRSMKLVNLEPEPTFSLPSESINEAENNIFAGCSNRFPNRTLPPLGDARKAVFCPMHPPTKCTRRKRERNLRRWRARLPATHAHNYAHTHTRSTSMSRKSDAVARCGDAAKGVGKARPGHRTWRAVCLQLSVSRVGVLVPRWQHAGCLRPRPLVGVRVGPRGCAEVCFESGGEAHRPTHVAIAIVANVDAPPSHRVESRRIASICGRGCGRGECFPWEWEWESGARARRGMCSTGTGTVRCEGRAARVCMRVRDAWVADKAETAGAGHSGRQTPRICGTRVWVSARASTPALQWITCKAWKTSQ